MTVNQSLRPLDAEAPPPENVAPRPPDPDQIADMIAQAEAAVRDADTSRPAQARPFVKIAASATLWLGVGIASASALFILAAAADVGAGLALAAVAGLLGAVFLAGAASRAYSPAVITATAFRRATGAPAQRAAQLAGVDVLAGLSISERVLDCDPDPRLISARDGVVAYANSAYFALARDAGVIGAAGLPPRIDRLFAQQGVEASKVFRLCRAAKSGAAAQETLHQLIGIAGGGVRRRFEASVRPVPGTEEYVSWRLRELPLEEEKEEELAAAYADYPRPIFAIEKSGVVAWTNLALRKGLGAERGALRHIDDIILGETGALIEGLARADRTPLEARVRREEQGPADGVFVAFRRGGLGEGFAVVELELREDALVDEGLSVSHDMSEAPFGVVIVDGEIGRDAKVVQANKAFTDVFGAVGKNASLAKLLPKDTMEELAAELKRKTSPGEGPRSVEACIGDGPGARAFAVYVRPVKRRRGGYGARKSFLYTVEITERKRMEDDYVQNQKLKAIGNIAGEVAHDFNNLLQVIHGNCELLMLRHPVGDPSYPDLVLIRENAQRGANLTKQLLAYSRKQTLTRKAYSVTDLLVDFSRFLDRMIGERVKLDLVNGRGLPQVKIDRTQFETAIMNLAVNARDAMAPAGGVVTIRTSAVSAEDIEALGLPGLAVSDHLLIEVKDTGPGVPPEIVDKIFDPFFTTKEAGKGTGLGLSAVHGVIGQMGGAITVENAEEGGAVFRIYLPAYDPDVDGPDAEEEVEGVPSNTDFSGTGRILVVEDDDGVRMLVVKTLQRNGYDVTEVEDGERALERLAVDAAFDLVLTDVMMPVVDGPSLISEARAEHGLKASVIFMSGYAEQAMRDQLDAVSESEYIQKPFQMSALSAKIKEALQKRREASS